MKTKYKVQQKFERVGDATPESHETREAAETSAAIMREEIAAMVSEWELPEDDDSDVGGVIEEAEVWEEAESIARKEARRQHKAALVYGKAAGEYIAEQAVEIVEITHDDEDEADE